VKDNDGQTPLSVGCAHGQMSVRLLLKDLRVDATLDDKRRCTALWIASSFGEHEVVEWFIASGRDLGDVKRQNVEWEGREYSALDIAREEKRTEVVSVLERFIADPAQTRHELRVKLVPEELAAEVFALAVFLCDELLQLKPAPLASANATTAAFRFFTIIKRLPMELQMILCHRVVGSMRQNILRKDSEAAFKSLAKVLLLPPSQRN